MDIVHYEADQYFTDKHGVYEFDGSKLGYAHEWCQNKTFTSLKEGKTVIVSNTFTTIKELRPYFKMSLDILLKYPTVILLQSNYGNIHGVSDEVIKKMKNRFAYDISELYNGENHV